MTRSEAIRAMTAWHVIAVTRDQLIRQALDAGCPVSEVASMMGLAELTVRRARDRATATGRT